MQNLFTRIAMYFIAFGFFISCSKAYEPVFTQQTEVSAQELLDQVASLRSQYDQNPEADYLEGLAYSKLAREKAVADRKDDYRAMKQVFSAAQFRLESSRNNRSLNQSIHQVLETTWSFEHNSGAGIIASDSGRTTNRLRIALAHAQNAILIQPDSLISYELLADTYAMLGNPSEAINTLLLADSLHHPRSQRIHEHLAFLYLNSDNAEESVKWYESALRWQQSRQPRSVDPGEPTLQRGSLINTWHGLINAYIVTGQSENAITSLEELLKVSPANTSYKSVLAGQLVNRISTQFESESTPDRSLLINTIDHLTHLSKDEPVSTLNVAMRLTEIATTTVETRMADNESFSATSDIDIMLLCEAAISLYQAVLAIDSTNSMAISGIADTYLVLGNESEASKWFELIN